MNRIDSTSRLSPALSQRGNAKVAVIGLLAVAAIGAAVWYFVLRDGAGGAGGKAISEYVPKDVTGYGSVDMAGLRKSPLYQSFKPQIDGLMNEPEVKASMEKAGVKEDSVNTVVFGLGDVTGDRPKMVVAFQGSFDEGKFVEAAKGEIKGEVAEKELSGTKYYYSPSEGMGFAAGGKGTVIFGTEDLVGKSLAVRGGGESVQKNAALTSVAAKVDRGATFFMAMALPAEAKSAAGMLPSGMKALETASHFALSVDLSGDLVLKAAVEIAEEQGAKDVASAIAGFLPMAKMASGQVPEDLRADFDAFVDSLKIEASGKAIVLNAKVPKAALEKIAAMAKDGGLMDLL